MFRRGSRVHPEPPQEEQPEGGGQPAGGGGEGGQPAGGGGGGGQPGGGDGGHTYTATVVVGIVFLFSLIVTIFLIIFGNRQQHQIGDTPSPSPSVTGDGEPKNSPRPAI